MRIYYRSLFILGLSLGLALLSVTASASQIEGTVQGFNCVTTGKVCPVGKEDPMIAAERLFVLFTGDGKYYFVPNLDRAIMARHIRQQVRVSGDIDPKFKSIKAQSLEVRNNEKWETAWSVEMERDAAKAMNISGF